MKVLVKETPPICSFANVPLAASDDCHVRLQIPNPPESVEVNVMLLPEQIVLSLASTIVICGSETIVI